MNRSHILLNLVALLILGSGCSQKIAFKGGTTPQAASNVVQPAPPVDPIICAPGVQNVAKPTKFILVVDESGSNFDGPFEHPGMATDKDKALRSGAIGTFLALYGSKTNVSWSFLTFQGTTASALTNLGAANSPVFVNATAMAAALLMFQGQKDQGNTPYLAALQMAQDLIAKDRAAGASADTLYRIVFMTDGYPTDLPVGPALESAIDSGISNLMSVDTPGIQMSTVYYGLPDASASARLSRMAAEGAGQFLDVSNSNGLKLGDIVQVPLTTCQ